MKVWCRTILAGGFLWAASLFAGELTLINGKVLTGTTIEATEAGVELTTGSHSVLVPWDMVNPSFRLMQDADYRRTLLGFSSGSGARFAPLNLPEWVEPPARPERPAWLFKVPESIPISHLLAQVPYPGDVLSLFALHYGPGEKEVMAFLLARPDAEGVPRVLWTWDVKTDVWAEAAGYSSPGQGDVAYAFRMVSLRSRSGASRVDSDLSFSFSERGGLWLSAEVRLGQKGVTETWQLEGAPQLAGPEVQELRPVPLLGPLTVRMDREPSAEALRLTLSLRAGAYRVWPKAPASIDVSVTLADADGTSVQAASAGLDASGRAGVVLPWPDGFRRGVATARAEAGRFFDAAESRLPVEHQAR